MRASSASTRQCVASIPISANDANGSGYVSASTTFATGVVVTPGMRLVPMPQSASWGATLNPSLSGSFDDVNADKTLVLLRGYLTSAE